MKWHHFVANHTSKRFFKLPSRVALISVSVSAPQIVLQSVRQSVPQSIHHSISQSVPQSIPHGNPQSVPQSIPHGIPQRVPQSIRQGIPQNITVSLTVSFIGISLPVSIKVALKSLSNKTITIQKIPEKSCASSLKMTVKASLTAKSSKYSWAIFLKHRTKDLPRLLKKKSRPLT